MILPLRLATAGLLLPLLAAPVALAAKRPASTSTTTTSSTSSTTSTAPANLLTGDTAALTASTGSWVAENGTLSLPTPGVLATATTTAGWSLTKSGPTTPTNPGTVYTGSFQVQAETTSRQVVPYLYFYDSAGTVLDKVKGEVAQDAVGSWTAVTPVVGIAPSSATSVALVLLSWGTAAGEAHDLTAPVLTARTPATPNVVGPLRTVGNKLYDANGPLVFKGVNLTGYEVSPTGQNLTAEDVTQAKRWGANAVRLELSSAFWLSSDCHYSAGYAGLVDTVVSAITSRGMIALVDLHTNNINGCGMVRQQPMADATAVDFWKALATRYRSNPLVAFELYNEPHDISNATWLNGGSVTTPEGTYTAVGMQQLYKAVRGTGATNLVVVGGTAWASTAPTTLVSGTNIAYAVHAYTCPTGIDANCQPNPTQPPANLAGWSTLASTQPVLATEFGWPSGTSGTYNANMVSYLKAHGWGWTVYAFDGTTTGLFTLLGTAGPGASYQPSASGMPILTALSGG